MEEPLFKTQKTGHLSSVKIYPDKLTYSSKLTPLAQVSSIPLDQIKQIAFVPKPPGANPNLIDLAIKVQGKPIIVLKDLDIGEAKEMQEIIKQKHISKPKEVREEHPFTLGGRVSKAIKEKHNRKSQVKPMARSATKTIVRLPFRS